MDGERGYLEAAKGAIVSSSSTQALSPIELTRLRGPDAVTQRILHAAHHYMVTMPPLSQKVYSVVSLIRFGASRGWLVGRSSSAMLNGTE